jgi:hypothetical protein
MASTVSAASSNPRHPGSRAYPGTARPSKRPVLRQQRRKAVARAARARIVAAELLDQLGAGTDDAVAAL